MKKQVTVCILVLAATTAAAIAAFWLGINPPAVNVIGAYASIFVGVLAAKLFHVSDGLYYTGIIFIFFASAVGSVLDLYRSFGPYDKIVHFASGLLLAAVGVMIAEYFLEKLEIKDAQRNTAAALTALFAFFVAGAGAGLWEIFEFAADKMAGGGMQRGMVDTLTDMIAGNLGGLGYAVWIGKRKSIH
ncbi:MAG: DUF2238 domain-containing protein [Emergencia sp.]